MSAWLALFVLAFGALLLVKSHGGDLAGIDSDQAMYLAIGIALLIFIGGGLLSRYHGRFGAAFRDAVTWLALGLGLVTAYTYRDELEPIAERVAAELTPDPQMTVGETENGTTEVRIRKRFDGHFDAKVNINNQPISMVVDTGATTIVLRPEDARKAGIQLSHLVYAIPVLTANGRTMAARARIDNVAVGPLHRSRVEALVAAPGTLSQSLLGMSFLSRLHSYEFSGDFLTLRG